MTDILKPDPEGEFRVCVHRWMPVTNSLGSPAGHICVRCRWRKREGELLPETWDKRTVEPNDEEPGVGCYV